MANGNPGTRKAGIKARVITTDGAVHWLDPKTLNDVPVHQNEPDMYSDERKYGGPLPALAPGAIVEEEVIVRDTAPLFAAGMVQRWVLEWNVPVNKTHVAITHPESLPVHYQVHLMPEATVTTSNHNGVETITLEQGPLPAHTQNVEDVPSDVVLRPEVEFSTGTSWQQVATQYARESDDRVRLADVKDLIANINARDGSRNEVIRRMVAALHKNVRYTGVEFGESSLVPQFPSETLKRKYGDCKDKATVLVAMLRAAGIPATPGPSRCRIRAQDVNTTCPAWACSTMPLFMFPPPAQIRELWIDATAQYSQVGTLPWMDYGRWALVVGRRPIP